MVIEDHIDVVHLHQGCILLLQASLGSPEDFIYIYIYIYIINIIFVIMLIFRKNTLLLV